MPPSDDRYQLMMQWLETDLGLAIKTIQPASTDASFRRYFRAEIGHQSYIVMDAPPPEEDVRPFIRIQGFLAQAGLKTPAIEASHPDQGFLLLGDLGQVSFLDALDEDSVDLLYESAMKSLLALTTRASILESGLPPYDEALLRRELDLFPTWCLKDFLGLEMSLNDQNILSRTFDALVQSALDQPRVVVHRDFHSRNLMMPPEEGPGVLDFQDAVVGPITYDLVSLLRDCYIEWAPQRVDAWVKGYHASLLSHPLMREIDLPLFMRWFDLMGMQRHLKAAGIFCRLKIRDQKPSYLQDLPRTLGYVVSVGQRYPEFNPFIHLMTDRVLPPIQGKISS
ncbi:MAG: phosphotransferase [Methylococcus sp.]|jgi:aminoglycoside/choline kinase family phosphotransferase